MNLQQAHEIKRHFLVWSGGFPPETKQEIFTYVELARQSDLDETEVWVMLNRWMDACNRVEYRRFLASRSGD